MIGDHDYIGFSPATSSGLQAKAHMEKRLFADFLAQIGLVGLELSPYSSASHKVSFGAPY